MQDLAAMSVSELAGFLVRLKDELAEVESERAFVMGQTGYHLPGRTVKMYEAEIDSLKGRIAAAEAALAARGAGE